MSIKSQRDFGTALMFIIIGLGFALGALRYSFGDSSRPGPGYFPFGLGLLLALIGALILVRSLLLATGDGERIGTLAWKPLAMVIGSVALAGITLPWLGMFISLPLLVVGTALAGEEFHAREVAMSAGILTAGSWAVFNKGLGLMIPVLPVFVH